MNLVISTEFQALRASGSDVAHKLLGLSRQVVCDSVSSVACVNSQTALSCQQAEALTFDIWALSNVGSCRVGEPLKDTQTGTIKLKKKSTVLPCVLARGGVSATCPRLWPATPLTVTVQGPRDSICCTAYTRRQTQQSAAHRGVPPRSPMDQGRFHSSRGASPHTSKAYHREETFPSGSTPQPFGRRVQPMVLQDFILLLDFAELF